jgi:hypothetical protein
MGFFGSLIGWDQAMGATNAVLANHLLMQANSAQLRAIASEVGRIVLSVRPSQQVEALLGELNKSDRVAQMNFVALACDNLGIEPTIRNNVWTRVKNPYLIGTQVDVSRINAALEAVEKQDKIRISWPGIEVKVNFLKMLKDGTLG